MPNLVSLAQNFLEPEEWFYPRKTTDVDIAEADWKEPQCSSLVKYLLSF